MDQPKIPTLKDSQKPQVKVRGLGAGLSFFDRIKQFNKKDLAFILAGLGTLFMAPLADHFMMSPDNGDASLSPGFGSGKGAGPGIFGAEDRTSDGSGTAVGSPVGGSDVITPLNVRDPSSLIMGPGSSSQPPTNSSASVAPSVSAPGRSDQDVRDALAGAASHAASAAVKKSLLPVPKIGLSGSSLRGLGVATGNSSATAGGGPSMQGLGLGSHGNVANNMAGVKGGGNIASVGPRGLTTGADALTALKAAGDKAGGMFDRAAGSAQGNLNAAANEAIPSGGGPSAGGGSGPGGGGPGDKPGNGGGPKDSKSGGESLAYELMKQNLQKQLELYWKEQEAMDPTLELYKMRNSMAEAVAGQIGTTIGNFAGGALTGVLCKSGLFGGSVAACFGLQSTFSCIPIGTNGQNLPNAQPIQVANYGGTQVGGACGMNQSTTGVGTPGAATSTTYAVLAFANDGNSNHYFYCQTSPPELVNCTGASPANPTAPGSGTPPPAVGQLDGGISGAVGGTNAGGLSGIATQCNTIPQLLSTQSSGGTVSALSSGPAATWLKGAQVQMHSLATARMELTGASDGACGVQIGDNVPNLRSMAIHNIQSAMQALTIVGSASPLNQTIADGGSALGLAAGQVAQARQSFDLASSKIADALRQASGMNLNAYSGSDCGQNCSGVYSGATAGQASINSAAQTMQQAQTQLGALLSQAEDAVKSQAGGGQPAANDPTAPTDPTVKKVQGTNTLADNLNKAIQAYNNETPAPATPLTPPQLTPAGGQGGSAAAAGAAPASQTQAVDTQVAAANNAISSACGAMGWTPNCGRKLTSTDPQPAPLASGTTPQNVIDQSAKPINGARNTQWGALNAINTATSALIPAQAPAAAASH